MGLQKGVKRGSVTSDDQFFFHCGAFQLASVVCFDVVILTNRGWVTTPVGKNFCFILSQSESLPLPCKHAACKRHRRCFHWGQIDSIGPDKPFRLSSPCICIGRIRLSSSSRFLSVGECCLLRCPYFTDRLRGRNRFNRFLRKFSVIP